MCHCVVFFGSVTTFIQNYIAKENKSTMNRRLYNLQTHRYKYNVSLKLAKMGWSFLERGRLPLKLKIKFTQGEVKVCTVHHNYLSQQQPGFLQHFSSNVHVKAPPVHVVKWILVVFLPWLGDLLLSQIGNGKFLTGSKRLLGFLNIHIS